MITKPRISTSSTTNSTREATDNHERENIEIAVDNLISNKRVIVEKIGKKDFVFLPESYIAEKINVEGLTKQDICSFFYRNSLISSTYSSS